MRSWSSGLVHPQVQSFSVESVEEPVQENQNHDCVEETVYTGQNVDKQAYRRRPLIALTLIESHCSTLYLTQSILNL